MTQQQEPGRIETAFTTCQIHWPRVRSCLRIGDMTINMSKPVPNRWHRFWQRVFFGFTWEEVK
jgi:hypothetical protein